MKMDVKIDGALVELQYENPKGGKGKVNKTVKFEDFCSIISKGIKKVAGIELLPNGLRIQAESDSSVIVGYEFPERVGTMKFSSDGGVKEINSVWPWGLTLIVFKKDAKGLLYQQMYQFALKGPMVSLNDMLYFWPGSNVFDDARICTGDMLIKHVPDVASSGGFPHLFYNGISNTDLTGNKFNTFKVGSSEIDRAYKLFKHLDVKPGEAPKPFPYDILKQQLVAKEFIKCRGFKD